MPHALMDAVLALEANHAAEPTGRIARLCLSACRADGAPSSRSCHHTFRPTIAAKARGHSSVGTHVTCISLRDTTARHLYETKLEEMARVDDLTGLLTRGASARP